MSARTDSFEGLHVLLVTEDEARAHAIAKSLRERKAHVGDVRAGAQDPVALRGADLLVIDARRSSAIDARVQEVRSDVRARWASVATIDYGSLVGTDGTVDLRALEGVVSRLAGMDKALTERARRESSFETVLAPLGPTRTLRALALAGPTLHVELSDGTLQASVDLADELLVSAFAEQKGERWEAWSALARVIGMTDANVKVEQRAHATAMNIMEPVDQALETAAQERARHPEQFVSEQTEELSGLRAERVSAHPVAAAGSQGAVASTSAAPPARARTLFGVGAPVPPAPPSNAGPKPSLPPPSPALRRPTPLRPAGRDSFADTPTDPAAPGLLQRMAQTPANDSAELFGKKKPSEPELSISRDADEELGDESSEYDTGEVTVVADASQLDILRETLGKLDEPPADKPLTSTMPAPKGPGPSEGELEMVEAMKAAGSTADQPASVPSQPTPSQPTAGQPAAGQPKQEADTAAKPAMQVPNSIFPGEQRASAKLAVPAKSSTGTRAVILLVLALLAAAAVGWLFWQQRHKAERAPGKPPASAPRR